MNYLKKIFEYSNSDNIKEISLNIFKYMNDFEWTTHHYELSETLIENLEEVDDTNLSLQQIEDAVAYIIENKTNSRRIYSNFYDQYYEALEFISTHSINIDEIEDLFLDYKCKVYRGSTFFQGVSGRYSVPNFKILIYTSNNNVSSTFSTIWNVIGKRLPNEYKIQEILVKEDNDVLLSVLVTGPKKLVK